MGKSKSAERLDQALKERGLTDTRAAAATGLSAAQINRLRNGARDSFRLDAGLLLYDKLGIDPWLIAFGRPGPLTPSQPKTDEKTDVGVSRDEESDRELSPDLLALVEEIEKRIQRIEKSRAQDRRDEHEFRREISRRLDNLENPGSGGRRGAG